MPFAAPLFLIVYSVSIIPCESRFWGTPNFYSTRSTIVHLDQWLYDDVHRECSEHLDKSQIAAVLVSANKNFRKKKPPSSHACLVSFEACEGDLRYERVFLEFI